MPSNNTGPVRPVLEGEPSRRPRWQTAGAVALGLVLLVGVLWVLGRDRPVEETTVTTTLAVASTTATASTTTTVPASALDGIVLYVADGCAECAVLESTLRGLAGEVPVWVRPADGTVRRVPTVVFQFDGRVSARWEGQVAVNQSGGDRRLRRGKVAHRHHTDHHDHDDRTDGLPLLRVHQRRATRGDRAPGWLRRGFTPDSHRGGDSPRGGLHGAGGPD